MKYQIMMTGGKNIVIDQVMKDKVDQLLKGDDKWIEIGKDKFKVSTIKGIFQFQDDTEKIRAWDDRAKRDYKAWSDQLFQLAKLTPEQKTENDLKVRIFPGLKLSNIHTIKKEVKEAILVFFQNNPDYPRCPGKVWWPLIKPQLQLSLYVSRWFEYVFRNDGAIEDWAKFNHIKLNYGVTPTQIHI